MAVGTDKILAESRSCARHVTTLVDAFTAAPGKARQGKAQETCNPHVNQAHGLIQPRCLECYLPAQFLAILKIEHVRHTLKPQLSSSISAAVSCLSQTAACTLPPGPGSLSGKGWRAMAGKDRHLS